MRNNETGSTYSLLEAAIANGKHEHAELLKKAGAIALLVADDSKEAPVNK